MTHREYLREVLRLAHESLLHPNVRNIMGLMTHDVARENIRVLGPELRRYVDKVVQFECCGAYGLVNPGHVCDPPRLGNDGS